MQEETYKKTDIVYLDLMYNIFSLKSINRLKIFVQ